MKTFLIILLSVSLWGDILTTYRQNGIKNIEKELDLALTDKKYWEKYLKDKDTSFGYMESYDNILVCNKSESTLKLYVKDKKHHYKLESNYNALTGKMEGDKVKEGDLRTPIGIYNLTKKLSQVDSFYGPLAFVTSYPNLYDKYRGKNGSGIWIHGFPIKQERDDFTKGCIAIDNESIKCLDKTISINNTILIIKPESQKQNISKEKLTGILSSLYKWRYAWLYNDLKTYLDFYASDFIRFDGMNFKKFKKYKSRIFKKTGKKTIVFTDINILPYPNSEDIYQITFKEFYKSKTFKFTGNKVLMIKFKNNKMKIFTEK